MYRHIRTSREAWKLLNGVVTVYKPPEMPHQTVISKLKQNLVTELNGLKRETGLNHAEFTQKLQQIDREQSLFPAEEENEDDFPQFPVFDKKSYNRHIDEQTSKLLPINDEASVTKTDKSNELLKDEDDEKLPKVERLKYDYSLSPLVLGPGYDESDLEITLCNALRDPESGVLVLAINNPRLGERIQTAQTLSTYRVKVQFGILTDSGMTNGKVVFKTTFQNIKSYRVDKFLHSVTNANRKLAYKSVGLEANSQKTYDILTKGDIVRPPDDYVGTLIHNIKCIDLKLPYATLEISCFMPQFEFIKNIVSDLGQSLNSSCTASGIRCLRSGPFHAQDSILMKHLNLHNVLERIQINDKLIRQHSSIFYKNSQSNDNDKMDKIN